MMDHLVRDYELKGAWFDFARAHPREGEAIRQLVSTVMFRDPDRDDPWQRSGILCPDHRLSRGGPVELLCLRVAELLSLVEVDWLDG